MPISSPSELMLFLESIGARPKKSLSQNFLIDQNIVKKIVHCCALKKNESVLEIGPGPGAVTEELINAGAQVTAVEKDRAFAKALKRFECVKVVEGDILDFCLDDLPSGTKVVSNLPYHLTSPILTRLLPKYPLFSTLTLMMQKEVATRLLAPSGTKMYGSLTVFANFYADITDSFLVKASCFYPRPKVDSMVLTFKLKPHPQVASVDGFFELVHTMFQQRRKMIRASLGRRYGKQVLEQIEASGISPEARPEQLSLEQLLQLNETLG